jgi:trehalose 6-phosphate phosphatase
MSASTTEANPEAKLEQAAPIEADAKNTELRSFLDQVSHARQSALLLDFDGTLAPFRKDPAKVKPWAGIPALLDAIQATGKTRVVLISGRPALDVTSQLGLAALPEAWGLHGAERLRPNGDLEVEALPLRQQLLLNAARAALQKAGCFDRPGLRLEAKRNAVVVHWRGLSQHQAASAKEKIRNILEPIAAEEALELLIFDGGIEMRAGRTKGDAVRLLLAEMPASTPAAYLGDDATDEHAFHVLDGHGLSVLVRREWRPTAAQIWLRPPAGLRFFLNEWLRAIQRS